MCSVYFDNMSGCHFAACVCSRSNRTTHRWNDNIISGTLHCLFFFFFLLKQHLHSQFIEHNLYDGTFHGPSMCIHGQPWRESLFFHATEDTEWISQVSCKGGEGGLQSGLQRKQLSQTDRLRPFKIWCSDWACPIESLGGIQLSISWRGLALKADVGWVWQPM